MFTCQIEACQPTNTCDQILKEKKKDLSYIFLSLSKQSSQADQNGYLWQTPWKIFPVHKNGIKLTAT